MLRATLFASLLLPGLAQGHVVLDPPSAPAAAYVRVAFRVGHGCHGAATVRLTVALPPGLALARPQPKAGWTLAPRGAPTDPLVWEGGPLDDQHFEEFVALIYTPDRPGVTLNFPTVQGCVAGQESRWEGSDAPKLRLQGEFGR